MMVHNLPSARHVRAEWFEEIVWFIVFPNMRPISVKWLKGWIYSKVMVSILRDWKNFIFPSSNGSLLKTTIILHQTSLINLVVLIKAFDLNPWFYMFLKAKPLISWHDIMNVAWESQPICHCFYILDKNCPKIFILSTLCNIFLAYFTIFVKSLVPLYSSTIHVLLRFLFSISFYFFPFIVLRECDENGEVVEPINH